MNRTLGVISALLMASSGVSANPVVASAKLDVPARKKLLMGKDAHDHLRLFAVDETCFPENALDKFSPPPGGSYQGFELSSQLSLDQEHVDQFPAFQTWAKKFAKSGDKVVYSTFAIDNTFYGFIALCVSDKPILGPSEMSQVVDEHDPAFQRDRYIVRLDAAAATKIRKAKTRRIAFVYDDDVAIRSFTVTDDDLRDSLHLDLSRL